MQLAQGKTETAISSWDIAIAIYTQIQDSSGKIGAQINQAQGFQALGLFLRARNTLENEDLNEDIDKQQDPVLKVTSMLSLGNALRVVKGLDSSWQVLDKAEKVAGQLRSKEMLAEVLLSKGNSIQTLQQNSENDSDIWQNNQEALELYQRAAATSEKPTTQLQAQLNRLRLLVESSKPEQWSQAQTLFPQLQSLLESLPPSRSIIYARINFAQSLMKLAKRTKSAGAISSQDACTSSHPVCIAAQVVVTGIKQAQNLQDLRAKAYSLGTLGNLYEQTGQWSEAENFSKQALKLSQGIQANDFSSRWFWQLGLIKSALSNPQRNEEEAILAYEEAVNIFRYLRRDLVAVNRDVQFSFRDEVEPVYREYVRLLLQSKSEQPDTETLEKARKAIESLQLAELDNFFRSACLDSQPVQLEKIDSTVSTAVIYPVVLSDRLAVIVSLPNQPEGKSLKLHTVKISKYAVEAKVEELRQKLVIRSTYEFLLPAEDIYDWIIRPIEADLQNSGTKNLVFVLDGRLQTIPIAALYDNKKK